MLGKHYSLGSVVEETGEARIKLANFEELKTQGEDIASFLNTFSPDSGFVYLHVIAMGAGEYYGCNINGDYFPERDLIARHNTFVTNAKVFKEHDNKPYSPDYGHVAFSWYNPKMHRVELILAVDKIKGKEFIDRQARGEQLEVSMGCFPAGTRVSLGDYSFKNIEDIQPGDYVVTHTGNSRKVVTKMMYQFTGKMCTLKIGGQTRTLTATDNHPILVRRYTDIPTQTEGVCPVCGKHVRQVYTHLVRSKQDDHIHYMDELYKSKYEYQEDWVRADEVKVGDYVVTPNTLSCENSDFDDALALICGYFLAEGSYVKYKGTHVALQFNFADTEVDLHRKVLHALTKLSSVVPSYQIRAQKHLGCISIYDRELAEKIYSLCGEYSHYKYINESVFAWSKDLQLKLLGAYIDGDGTWNKINKKVSCVTVSPTLADGIFKLATKCGLTVSIAEYDGKKSRTYALTFNGADTEALSKVAAKVPNYDYEWKLAKLPSVFNDNGMVIHRVQDITYSDAASVTVYNLSVEEDESFVAENIAVHNCKVAFDVCSICGNKAKKSSDYCEHIRRDKKKIYPDGRQPYMINYNPTFFDISIVRRRADRIAYVLSKVASADASITNLMAEEFENLGNDIPLAPDPERAVFDIDEEFEKAASLEQPKSMTLAEKVAMVKRINASAVKVMDESVSKLIPKLEAVEPDLPVELLDKMALKYSIPDILKAFAYRAIPMKPREFTRIVIVQKGLPLESFREVLNGIMQAKVGLGNVKDLQEATYRRELGSLLDDYIWSRSSFLPAIIHRLDKLKGMEKRAAAFKLDPIQSYLELNPRLAFGHVRRDLPFQNLQGDVQQGAVAVYRDPYATTPVQVTPEVLERELRQRELRQREAHAGGLADPVLNPAQTAMLMGGAYLAYRDSEILQKLLATPQGAAIVAAVAAALHTKAKLPTVNAMKTKVAGVMTEIGGKIVLPFVGAHFASAHFRNKYNNGYELNAAERFIAENPDVISLVAPIALNFGLRKHAAVQDLPLINCDDLPGVEKLAEISDETAEIARNVLSGIILNSKRRSLLSNLIDFQVDSHLINKATDQLAQSLVPEANYQG